MSIIITFAFKPRHSFFSHSICYTGSLRFWSEFVIKITSTIIYIAKNVLCENLFYARTNKAKCTQVSRRTFCSRFGFQNICHYKCAFESDCCDNLFPAGNFQCAEAHFESHCCDIWFPEGNFILFLIEQHFRSICVQDRVKVHKNIILLRFIEYIFVKMLLFIILYQL